jgi:hypothetical protein
LRDYMNLPYAEIAEVLDAELLAVGTAVVVEDD